MITIGIDPGIEKTGIGIVEKNKQKSNLIYQYLIKTSPKVSHGERLKIIYDDLCDVISLFSIDYASIEKVFFAKNVKTASIISEVRGVLILALQQNNIPIYQYTPLQVKQALTGYGKATKRQIQELVKLLLDLKEIPKPDDVADGIALAITHINTFKTISRIKDKKNYFDDYMAFRR
ncbi:MAG: crossover junction endodeoxyribonuclease RuvC [Spirochaetes bacterium]|nr:crossover junction endodeoxyribonuclease RuvC [Spirochaetota bacterium]